MKTATIAAVLSCMILKCTATFASQSVPIAFIDVHVLTMQDERVLRHQTVIVQDRAITAIGPAPTTAVPDGAQRIEGHGSAFLSPGLADMHTHVSGEQDLVLFIANGVTTILNMGEAPSYMVAGTNERTDSGVVVGPRSFYAMLIDGTRDGGHFFVSTPEQARHAVALAKTNGYDFIKVYNKLTAAQFAAIIDEARRQNLPVIGHGVREVGLPQQLFDGQVMVAHAEEFYYTAFRKQEDYGAIDRVAADVARSGAFVTPNLSLYQTLSEQWGKPAVAEAFVRDPRARLMAPELRLRWTTGNPYTRRSGSLAAVVPFLKQFTKALSDAGVPLLAGTDTPLPGMFPGYSIHDDIRALIDAGLSPYQALASATSTPAQFIGKYVPGAQPFGTIEIGRRADLLLLETNPLLKIETLRSPLGVMRAGKWYDAADIAQLLKAQKATYDGAFKSGAAP